VVRAVVAGRPTKQPKQKNSKQNKHGKSFKTTDGKDQFLRAEEVEHEEEEYGMLRADEEARDEGEERCEHACLSDSNALLHSVRGHRDVD
jgi:hypothetical protein